MKIQNAFNDFYNEFKDWTKEEILQRTFDIILESSDKDRQLEAYENMRKEAKNFIQENKNKTIATYGDDYDYEVCLFEEDIKDLLNILNKVGGDNDD